MQTGLLLLICIRKAYIQAGSQGAIPLLPTAPLPLPAPALVPTCVCSKPSKRPGHKYRVPLKIVGPPLTWLLAG